MSTSSILYSLVHIIQNHSFPSVSCILLVILICGIFAFLSKSNSNDIDKYLDLGAKYLEEQDYDNAIAAYTETLKIDDMSVNAYIGLADAYIGKYLLPTIS